MRKMKKYFGLDKWWSETLYYYTIDEFDLAYFKECGEEFSGNAGDRYYYLPEVPCGDNDKNSIYRIGLEFNNFEDTNAFITNSEMFNVYKDHRI